MQRSNKKSVAYFVSLFLLLSLFSGFQNAYANGAAAPLVETQWLADNLKKSDIRILHVGEVENNFNAKHIPGSVFLNVGDLMGLMNLDKAKFEGTMSRLGIDNDAHVVIVGAATGTPFPVTAFWLMKAQGHSKVSLLNGGVAKWVNENRQMTGDATGIKASKYTAVPDMSVFADAKYVLANMKNPKFAILDVRGADEYSGANSVGMNKRTGHIPGAVNLDSIPTNNNNDGTFKSAKDLQAVYTAKGITKDKEVITYCQGGVRASNTYFVLKHILGYPNVRNYVGSWGEWGDRLDPAKYPAEK